MTTRNTYVGGVGCFAGGSTLIRMFKKILENLILIKHEEIYPAIPGMLSDNNATRFFRGVIQSTSKGPDQIDRALELFSAATNINGFFIGLSRESLYLLVFYQDAGRRRSKLTIRLDHIACMRKNRLH